MSIVDKLINDFSKENFVKYIEEKIDDLKFLENSEYQEEKFKVEPIAKINLEDRKNLLIYTIKTDELSERSSRRKQFDIAKRILIDNQADAGIFAFYDKNQNFRLSLVYSIYQGAKRDFSSYKRYTFFIEKAKKYRTIEKALKNLSFNTLDEIKDIFSVKPLVKEFYEEIQNWYALALEDENVYFPGGSKEENLIRLLTRTIFVWFLKQKNLIPEEIFDEERLNKILKDFKKSTNYYNAILQNLFFATLNKPRQERAFAKDEGYPKNKTTFGVKSLYRYEKLLLIKEDDFIKLFENTPFINGGLFECLDQDKEYIDGFSRNEEKRAKLPDYLFFSEEKKYRIKKFYEKEKSVSIKGLINILEEYNFTADESTPTDIELSLDPELLGHIFENLLASFNEETKETARKRTGSYYTPKEIVDFMVNKSLFYYFKDKTNLEDEKLEAIIFYNKNEDLIDQEKQDIVSAIDKLKILDPAVGSGAFPMGILHKLVDILHVIDEDNKLWHELQRKKIVEEMDKVFKIENKEERQKFLDELNENFDETLKYPDFARKLYLIQNSIYGVDIQSIAIQISKLRFFLSLIIDQKIDLSKENFGIKPLPHLETKFVCADTLIGLEKPKQSHIINSVIGKLREELRQLYKKYFNIKNRNQKQKLEDQVKKLKEEIIAKLHKTLKEDTIQKITSFDIFSQTSKADWFDPEWMFGLEDRFDIIIGNPPYIQLQDNSGALRKRYEDKNFEVFDRKGDIYTLFYEKGINLLKDGGYLCFITSNKWMRAGYGKKLRKFFLKYNPKILIDLGPDIFENATVDTNILLIQKAENQNKLEAITLKEKTMDIEKKLKENAVILENLTEDAWFIGDDKEQRLKEKIEKIGKPLKDWDIEIYYGIKTGLNEAFIIDTETRNKILANCTTEEERKRTEEIIKPILKGGNIKRYCYEWKGLWIILAYFGFYKEAYLYTSIVEHLKKFEEQLKNRGQCRYARGCKSQINKDYTGQHHWLELDNNPTKNYLCEFEKEKLVWTAVNSKYSFTIVPPGYYFDNSVFMITGNNLKLWCAIFNSKLIRKYLEFIFSSEENYTYGSKESMEQVVMPIVTPDNQVIVNQIESLVDQILDLKKQNPNKDTSSLESQIDKLVYKLYDLTDEEIELINRDILAEKSN